MNEAAAWVVSSWCLRSQECGRNGLFRDVQEPPPPPVRGTGALPYDYVRDSRRLEYRWNFKFWSH